MKACFLQFVYSPHVPIPVQKGTVLGHSLLCEFKNWPTFKTLASGQVRNGTTQIEPNTISMFSHNFLKKGTFHNFMNEPQPTGR